MGWSYWDDYWERNSEDVKPVQKTLTLEQQVKQEAAIAKQKILAEKRRKIVKRFNLTDGQKKRLVSRANEQRLDELFLMSSWQIENELCKVSNGSKISMTVKNRVNK